MSDVFGKILELAEDPELDEMLFDAVTSDGPGLVRAVVKAFGENGHAKVQAILNAELAAVRAAVDVLEDEAVAKETKP